MLECDLPSPLAGLLRPLFQLRPPMSAMAHLVGKGSTGVDTVAQVEAILDQAVITPALEAGLWLYVDELDRSHRVSQSIPGPTGSYWHGIMHRREGDFSNSHYWFRKVGAHPAMATIPDYSAHTLVDAVAAWSQKGSGNEAALVALQRHEWTALFNHCAVGK